MAGTEPLQLFATSVSTLVQMLVLTLFEMLGSTPVLTLLEMRLLQVFFLPSHF